jgi:hypothetical protein
MGLPANERLNYKFWPIPFKDTKDSISCGEHPACILGNWIIINEKNLCFEALSQMNLLAKKEDKIKYENTISFLDDVRKNVERTPHITIA